MEEQVSADTLNRVRKALAMSGIAIDNNVLLVILETYYACDQVGDNFSIKDAVAIQKEVDARYPQQPVQPQ